MTLLRLIFGGLVCLVLAGGCDPSPADVSACYQRCRQLDSKCGSRAAETNVRGGSSLCVCTCYYPMPFIDGVRP